MYQPSHAEHVFVLESELKHEWQFPEIPGYQTSFVVHKYRSSQNNNPATDNPILPGGWSADDVYADCIYSWYHQVCAVTHFGRGGTGG
jgi:hypothetical protein